MTFSWVISQKHQFQPKHIQSGDSEGFHRRKSEPVEYAHVRKCPSTTEGQNTSRDITNHRGTFRGEKEVSAVVSTNPNLFPRGRCNQGKIRVSARLTWHSHCSFCLILIIRYHCHSLLLLVFCSFTEYSVFRMFIDLSSGLWQILSLKSN